MVSVEKAKALLMNSIDRLIPLEIKIESAVDCILAEDVLSPVNLPPFNQAAMDGFAIKICDKKKYKLIGEIKAGDKRIPGFSTGEAVRIFTGAVVPPTSDCVVMQERTIVKGSALFIENARLKKNENIRLAGSHIRKGMPALKKGTKLNPASIGFLASLGILKVPVYKKPDVAIIITGNELMNPGTKLNNGQVYESNSFALKSGLNRIGINPKSIYRVRDNKKKLSEKIMTALSFNDIVIISGGISVGKYDLVKECLEENNVKEIIYKVAQKPGKPLFVGKAGNKIVFGLPGNPAATLVCFYEYVYPAIKKMMGFKDTFLPIVKMKLLGPDIRKGERSLFLKGQVRMDGVLPLKGQESNIMKSFAEADCLIYLPAGKNAMPSLQVKKNPAKNDFFRTGEMVEVHFL